MSTPSSSLLASGGLALATRLARGFETGSKVLNQAVRRNPERFPEGFMFQRYFPLVFTEQGLAMLSSVLRSKRAIQVNIAIMKTFVKLREMLTAHRDLAEKLASLEKTPSSRWCLMSSEN